MPVAKTMHILYVLGILLASAYSTSASFSKPVSRKYLAH